MDVSSWVSGIVDTSLYGMSSSWTMKRSSEGSENVYDNC